MPQQVSTSKKITILALVLIALFFLIFMGKLVSLLTDYLWFKELRLMPLFLTGVVTKLSCGFITGFCAAAIMALNILLALSISSRSQKFGSILDAQTMLLLNRLPNISILFWVATAIVSVIVGIWASNHWEICLKSLHGVPFGLNDPLFSKDIGFYVFQLPFLRFLYRSAVLIVVFSLASSILIYLVRENCAFDGRRVLIAPRARTHLLVLVGLCFVSLFFAFQFKAYELTVAQGAIVNGAGYAQIKAYIPFLTILRYISILAAIMTWATIFSKSLRLLAVAVLLLIAGVGVGFLATQVIQKFVVGPDELAKETPYIEWSIANTRTAYGLDRIETKHFVPTGDLNAESLGNNALTIDNIRLWEHAPLLATYSQLQEIRTYYEFLDVDNDRYTINGQYRQVMLSPRELLPSSLPSRIWINEHLTYTHGYGLCLGPVNKVTAEGLPDFFIKNIPPSSTIPLTVTKPQIYYGEADAGYAIVKTGAKEFDYPSGNENVYTVYDGTGGIRIGGFFRKLLFALRFQELKILLRSDIGPESRIMFSRPILYRFQKAVPFLKYDSDPYMVITYDGRLVWIVDGYTTSDAYPYSATVSGIGNYIRNSVKAVIDAYNGKVAFYISDLQDPIIKTYAKIFPNVFKPLDEMPTDIRSHIRYPQTLFTVQAQVYSVFHMTDPQVFYNKEDVWRIPDSYSESKSGPMNPYYTIMKLAGVGVKEEFILMVPFCPAKKENMIAWLAARCDEPNYGTLLVFYFPKQKLVYGPSQIESRINQVPEISKQLTLWNQGGSRVIRGSLLVIPVEHSLLYVQPLYLTSHSGSQSGGVPELKRVIVAYENNIAMEPTLDQSLGVIFGSSRKGSSDKEAPGLDSEDMAPKKRDIGTLINEASRHFEAGQEEMQRGNWAGYGEAMKKLERVLRELGKATQ
ncbi:MAG: UPF0182 family protein [Chitinispirillaceae bacterium]|nr:UPF0182 family protein [Chitinispirillaceae bacterium]